MARSGRRDAQSLTGISWTIFAVALLGGPGQSCLLAADVEYRDFTITVDGSKGGEYHMTINCEADGTQTMRGHADVKISYLGGIKVYRYSYRGSEVWKNGRLARFESTCNDDGKHYAVQAVADGNSLRVRANGQERVTRPDVWLTTYWRLPDVKLRNQALPLLDADTGKDLSGNLQYVGMSQLRGAGQIMNCENYRLTGNVQVELWYDAQERLVRLQSTEDGHKYALDLARIGR